ncbi:MAG TPA: DUF2254 family protein [Longimicrobiales bacterium]|nr:DUF2254 family protein [Longimicrobiales bacterium]
MRSSIEDHDRFVPVLSVAVALVLALVSIGFLIFFINNIARSIQAEVILERIARDSLKLVDDLFPEEVGEPAAGRAEPAQLPAGDGCSAAADHSGYLQSIDEDEVLQIAVEHGLVIEMQCAIGDFVLAGDPLVRVWPADTAAGVLSEVSALCTLGTERTHYQDIQRGIIELLDIGVRALSPGVNDPTTALGCVDRLTQVLAALGTRRAPDAARLGEDGSLRFIARRPEFTDIIQLSYGELRHHGAATPAVALRLVDSMRRVAQRVSAERRAALQDQLAELAVAVRQKVQHPGDLRRIEQAIADARSAA